VRSLGIPALQGGEVQSQNIRVLLLLLPGAGEISSSHDGVLSFLA